MNALELIKNCPDAIVGHGASEDEINKAENELGMQFASDYRAYLQKYGAVMLNGHELSGISPAKHLSVISLTHDWQKKYDQSVKLYVIENLGIDDIAILQDSNGNIYQSQNGKIHKIFNSLTAYIAEICV